MQWCWERNIVIEDLVRDENIDVKAKDSDGRTALHYAAMAGHKEVVELLIDKGADVKAKDSRGVTPLHLAADVNAKDKDGYTPLDVAKNQAIKDLLKQENCN